MQWGYTDDFRVETIGYSQPVDVKDRTINNYEILGLNQNSMKGREIDQKEGVELKVPF